MTLNPTLIIIFFMLVSGRMPLSSNESFCDAESIIDSDVLTGNEGSEGKELTAFSGWKM